jgi:hypothetical protein
MGIFSARICKISRNFFWRKIKVFLDISTIRHPESLQIITAQYIENADLINIQKNPFRETVSLKGRYTTHFFCFFFKTLTFYFILFTLLCSSKTVLNLFTYLNIYISQNIVAYEYFQTIAFHVWFGLDKPIRHWTQLRSAGYVFFLFF